MGESAHHARLVARIVRWVHERHGGDPGLCVFVDAPEADRGSKPWPLGGYVPDVIARTVPASFMVVGEAKWYRDLHTPHSRDQLRAYLRHLALQPAPHLVLATPPLLLPYARQFVRRAQAEVKAEHVGTTFLCAEPSIPAL